MNIERVRRRTRSNWIESEREKKPEQSEIESEGKKRDSPLYSFNLFQYD